MIADDIDIRHEASTDGSAPGKALVMCISDPATDPRPRRMIKLLEANGFAIDVLSYSPSRDFATFDHIALPTPSPAFVTRAARRLLYLASCVAARALGRPRIFHDWLTRHYGWREAAKRIARQSYAVIVVEDLAFLPMATAARGEAALIFDAREYYPRQNEESVLFRLIEGPARTQLCRDYLHRCDRIVTVSPGLAAEFAREFAVAPEVVLSVPNYVEAEPRPTDPARIRMVHHGAANRNRRLEDMIEVVERLDERFELDIYLTGSPSTIDDLKRRAAGCPRIRILPPVKYEDIIPTIGTYDIGMFFNIPTTFNLRNALPNKLFEFIQARLLVAIGPSPDMKHFVEKYGCGVVAEEASVESMAAALNALQPEDIDRAKARSHAAARELCFEHESAKLQRIVVELTRRPPMADAPAPSRAAAEA